MTGEPEIVIGRVLHYVGGVYCVEVNHETFECALRGRLKQEKGLGRVAVGDEVEVEVTEGGSYVITGVRPRETRLSRRSADGRREQLIAANLDQLAAVFAVAEPEPVFSLLDRFLVLAEADELKAFVVVNKVDLSEVSRVRERFGAYERIGYEVVYCSAKLGSGLERLAERLTEHATLFVGPSGAGKSSLLNALQPGLGLRVGAISRSLRRGRHTTVAASMQSLDLGGYVVDTPGLSRLHFWEVGTRELAACFPEVRPHLGSCRFGDCRHHQEPECAVRQAVARKEIDPFRYESYLMMLEEADSD